MKGILHIINILLLYEHYVCVTPCQVHIKASQLNVQHQFTKPRHQPSDRDQRARDRLRNKVSAFQAKFKSPAYIALGAAALQTVYQTFDPDLPATFHLLALTTKPSTNTIPM